MFRVHLELELLGAIVESCVLLLSPLERVLVSVRGNTSLAFGELAGFGW